MAAPDTGDMEATDMAQQRCPRCDCPIRGEGFERRGVRYCCEGCATRFECECLGCAAVQGDGG